jgi:4-amino-4-deoxy-L-arabinose transferase-like glycosyltransferase
MLPSLVKERASALFLVATLAALLLLAILWMLDHPYGTNWDETEYLNYALTDQSCLHDHGLRSLRWEIFYNDRIRPPAYRILALPFFAVAGFSPLKARLVSLGFHWLALAFVFLTLRKLTNPLCAILTVLFICLSPEFLYTSITFGTEYPLMLATAAMLFFLVSTFQRPTESWTDWLALGLSLGLGLLAKASFLFVAAPVLGFVLLAGYHKALRGPRPWFAVKAGLVAALIAAPWWWVNIGPAMASAHDAREFVRHSLGTLSVSTLASWLWSAVQCVLGYGSAVVIAILLVAWLHNLIRQQNVRLDPVQRTTLLACLCAAVPLILAQLSGTNHLLRHLAPAMMALAVAAGLLAYVTGCLRSRAFLLACGVAFSVQLGMLAFPVLHPNTTENIDAPINGFLPWQVMARRAQWNWESLHNISREHGQQEPVVSYLGNGRSLNSAQIQYAWVADGAPKPGVKLLWRYEQGAIDWDKVMEAVDRSDLVITAPGYVGDPSDKQDLDNLHNAELAQKLSQDHRFEGPIRLGMGRFEPVEVQVFVKVR